MFIGGLNWETTEKSLKDYFSQFGEVTECTVMRDGATGRSRGFGFLTFRDPKTVNIVMVKEHYLDGKIIDPKRAIPREEQERTAKIFVGGVSTEATEADFKNYFKQFGRVIDATLMMDKDTGRPRGFGFVTFDGDEAVDACLAQPLDILGKPIEVKRAQPRGNMRDDDNQKFGRRGFGRGGGAPQHQDMSMEAGNQNANMGSMPQNTQGMSPAMMAQYWQKMQQYFAMMQQNLQMAQQQQMGGGMPMGMNPAMMQQMMAMQQQQQQQQQGRGQNPQSPGMNPAAMMGMNPAMMQQMQAQAQAQQQAAMQGQGQGPGSGSTPGTPPAGPSAQLQQPGAPNPTGTNGANPNPSRGYPAEPFDQQKYDRQQQQRMQQYGAHGGFGSPTSWDGMYDGDPQPGAGGGRGGMSPGGDAPVQPSQAPANAPTGPKNAGRPGANYRGGGRGGHRGGYHPYAR
ncbi:RNA-binding domain-containing protein [Eremomyces bilateralis CBS 781.70]|uniref:RNA-binding domain-containing protein n=1 Tax=Eremomyces bilateralis CBS 781.70 TaxID=1392243 RepID=A0A6G1FY96_9PEZI|nr:RNA-binding domain-containing protein [Eremomyces bilateralis CBS 781.70]KAF1810773.1 RNA-binding domain-containing protein [Eremomyces bilateralis CBS 781.70]